jgi:hypothetical protein
MIFPSSFGTYNRHSIRPCAPCLGVIFVFLLSSCATIFPANESTISFQLPAGAKISDTSGRAIPVIRDSFDHVYATLQKPIDDILIVKMRDSNFLVRPNRTLRALSILDQILGAFTSVYTLVDDAAGNASSYSDIRLDHALPLSSGIDARSLNIDSLLPTTESSQSHGWYGMVFGNAFGPFTSNSGREQNIGLG